MPRPSKDDIIALTAKYRAATEAKSGELKQLVGKRYPSLLRLSDREFHTTYGLPAINKARAEARAKAKLDEAKSITADQLTLKLDTSALLTVSPTEQIRALLFEFAQSTQKLDRFAFTTALDVTTIAIISALQATAL